MMLVKQIGPTTCGQACLAMIHGISLDESIRHVGHTGEVSDIDMLMLSGTDASFVDGPPSPDIVAIQKHRDPNGDREHWTVSFRGALLDPAEIGEKLWPVYKHFAVDWMC